MHAKLTAFCVALLVVLVTACGADARIRRGGISSSSPPPVACPKTTDNFCAASPGGTVQVANWFSGGSPTGKTYGSRPDVNYCGIDYACGVPAVSNPAWSAVILGYTVTGSCGILTLVDPATVSPDPSSNDPGCGKMPKNCSWANEDLSTNGAFLRSTISCTGTANTIVIKGFNLAPVGGHSGTYIQYDGSATGTKIRAFNYLEMDAKLYGSSSWANIASGSVGDTATISSTFNGLYPATFGNTAAGTATGTGIVMTVTACTVCNFAAGMQIGGISGMFTIITQQTSGTPGGIGTYEVNRLISSGSTAVNGRFAAYGGESLNTKGSILHRWNALIDMNSRGFGAFNGGGGTGVPRTVDYTVLQANYVNNNGMDTSAVHYEMAEYILANGNGPITYNNMIARGNIYGGPTWAAATSLTATYFFNTGGVGTPKTSDWSVTYANAELIDNVSSTPAGAAGGTSLMFMGGTYNGTYTMTGNWTDLGTATNYAYCTGAPTINDVDQASFFLGSQSTTNATLVALQGPIKISTGSGTTGWHFYEANTYFLSQKTAAFGGATYTGSMGWTATGTAVSGQPTQIDLVSVSGTVIAGDLLSGTGTNGRTISSQISGTTGKDGRYQLSGSNTTNADAVTATSRTISVDSGSVTGTIALNQRVSATGISGTTQIVTGSGLAWTMGTDFPRQFVAAGTTFTTSNGFTGTVTITGTAMTVAPGFTGTIAIGQIFTGGVLDGTEITAGSGLSWTVNNSQSVGPTTLSAGEKGMAGVYAMSGSATVTNNNRRAALDAFTVAPVISGNYDLDTGSLLSEATFFRLGTITSPCMYPGRAS